MLPISGPGRRRHLLDADHQHGPGALGLDRLDRLMDRGRSGRAGVLDPGRGLEAELVARLEDQGGGEILRREAAVEMAQHDLVHVLGADPRMVERLVGDAHDQAFDRLGVVFSEGRMRPADDTGGHGDLRFELLTRRWGCFTESASETAGQSLPGRSALARGASVTGNCRRSEVRHACQRPKRRVPGAPIIDVVAALICDARGQVLLVRKRGTAAFMQPGGKREPGEDDLDALGRELSEEIGCRLVRESAVAHGIFEAPAAHEPGRIVRAALYGVDVTGEIACRAEIAEMIWLDPESPGDTPLAALTRDPCCRSRGREAGAFRPGKLATALRRDARCWPRGSAPPHRRRGRAGRRSARPP